MGQELDTLQITWNQLLNDDLTPKAELIILERKTKKIRKIQISNQLGRRIAECYNQIKPTKITDNILISNKKTVFSIQRLNVILKELKIIYKIDIQNFSCHSLRKCFAREIYDKGNKSEYMLLKLSIILNHSSIAHTRRYIGIQDVEIADAYNLLTF